jgi:hypothetical protein
MEEQRNCRGYISTTIYNIIEGHIAVSSNSSIPVPSVIKFINTSISLGFSLEKVRENAVYAPNPS